VDGIGLFQPGESRRGEDGQLAAAVGVGFDPLDQSLTAQPLDDVGQSAVAVSAESPTDAVHAVQFAHAHGMRIAMPDTLRYHSISCACEQCIRMDERIPSVSPPVTIAFDADELCGYYEFHKFMYVGLRCGFGKGHTSKHYDYRHRTVF
jgi:hypothetical protein